VLQPPGMHDGAFRAAARGVVARAAVACRGVRFDLYQRTTYAAVEDGVKLALADAGLDHGDLELTAALRVALERTDACEAWLAGEPVFAGCEAMLPEDSNRRLPLA
jgi:hypothetical protein